MRKIYSMIGVLAFLALFTAPAFAAPNAEMSVTIANVREDEAGILFALNISMLAPSEPYASLDFNLVCSDYKQLAIVDNSAAGDRSNLDIWFAPDYGSAYHKGRIDGDTGAISYMIGIFSPLGGNAIKGAIDVCTATLRYTGREQVEISLEGLKLVYNDDKGAVTAVKDLPIIKLKIDSETLANIPTEIITAETPTADLQRPAESPGLNPLAVVALAVAALLALAVLILLRRNSILAKKLKPHSPASVGCDKNND